MRLHIRKTWPAWILLLAAASCWGVEHHVVVGGSTGGYYGGTPILMFNPPNITINVGDTVRFTNADGPHNVHADNGSFRCAQGCDGQGGNGDPIDSAWTSTVAFTQAGVVTYRCDNHGAAGMVGTITVQGTQPTGNVPITGAFTGAWFDPNQSGHGIFIEVIPNNQMLAWWFTFTPGGEQTWFGNVGTINGDTAVVNALTTIGGQWIPNFNPGAITQPSWGTLTFTFTDCNHGRVDFNGNGPAGVGYGTGHMDLSRLTQPVGVTCP
jgi:plastocyanin